MGITTTSFDHCIEKDVRTQLRHTLKMAPTEGAIMEFGVFRGKSIRAIAKAARDRNVYGFDSFVGLPEEWNRSEGDTYEKGHFKTPLPEVPGNVSLVKGFFESSLPLWLEKNDPSSVAFLHIDCDLYSSTVTILHTLDHLIQPGTIIVFDELCDWTGKHIYDYWEQGEWKALHEWLDLFKRDVEPISRTNEFSAAVKVTK